MIENVVLLLVAIALGVYLFRPRLVRSRMWRAIVSPLASIIGSGFLVVAPLLEEAVDGLAWLAMVGIVLLACAIGAVMRFNIAHAEPLLERGRPPRLLLLAERLSDPALALAYVISVAFYVRLMASFVLRGAGIESEFLADALTTLVIGLIGAVGVLRGLKGLERMEEPAVNVKLAIIGALLIGLAWYDVEWLASSAPPLEHRPVGDWLHTLRVLGGILLVVQGFEVSRYIGHAYTARERIRSMRIAQILSGLIYVVFIALAAPLMQALDGGGDETAIISLAARVAAVLPPLLILAAVMSQFSAAVADTAGAGGTIWELSGHRMPLGAGYAAVTGAAIVLVWSADIFEIIALASRAFAFYYFLQCLEALDACAVLPRAHHRVAHRGAFGALAVVLLLITLFAVPAG